MKQMKEEQLRRRMMEAKRNREIAQLKKEQRRQEVCVFLCSKKVPASHDNPQQTAVSKAITLLVTS